jgi:hypothetical protein
MSRQRPISAGGQHKDIRVGSTSGGRHTGNWRVQLVEAERLRVVLVIRGYVPNQDVGAVGAGILIKDDADS